MTGLWQHIVAYPGSIGSPLPRLIQRKLPDASQAHPEAHISAVADEAVSKLWAQGMFRSHPEEDRYDAVDGMGVLALSLMRLETGRKPDLMGLYF